jgi:elongation factor Ts
MAEISAKLVNELRNKTGLGMMQCKQFLAEAGGDVDKAIDLARKKGVKTSITERTASEGRVFAARSADGRTGALVEVNCNTDFTAKSEPLARLGAKAATALAANPGADVAQTVAADITAVAQSTGENVRIGRTATASSPEGKVGLYTYGITGKIAVALAFEGNVANITDELVTDLGGHIAFARPFGLDRSAIPADLVAKEREIAVEQAKATGKPQQIAEKIAEGKLNAFFAERALLDQEFFNAQKYKGTIASMLREKGLTLKDYKRVEVGQA